MPCCTKPERATRRRALSSLLGALLPLLLIAAALLSAATAQAEGIQVTFAALEPVDENYQLNADFEIALNPTLEQALKKGIVLYFVTEFDLVSPRWYWLDEKIAQSELQQALSYYALTRQYRLSRGSLPQNFDTLEEALQVLSRLRNRPVVESSALKTDAAYVATLRMRLDVSRLPKPFQIEAFGSRDWNLSSGRLQWNVAPLPPSPKAPSGGKP